MKTIWILLVGAKAGVVLLWRAKRAGRSFDEQLAWQEAAARVVQRGSLCDRCVGSGWNNGGTCSHCLGSGMFTSIEDRAALRTGASR